MAHARPLQPSVAPAMAPVLAQAIARLIETFPPVDACLAAAEANSRGTEAKKVASAAPSSMGAYGSAASASLIYDSQEEEDDDDEGPKGQQGNAEGADECKRRRSSAASAAMLGPSSWVQRPRLLLCGPEGAGQQHLGPALLYALEGLPVHAIGLPSLLSDPG